MMRFLRALILFAKRTPVLPCVAWEAEDARRLQAFLCTETGRKLSLQLVAHIAEANERAAMKAAQFECGWACGFRGLWAVFQSLSVPPAVQEEQSEHSAGAAEYLATIAP